MPVPGRRLKRIAEAHGPAVMLAALGIASHAPQVSPEVIEQIRSLAQRIEAETEGVPDMSCEIAHGLAEELLAALSTLDGAMEKRK